MRRTNSYFEDRQLDALDTMARDEGVSRSDILRRLVEGAIAGSDPRLENDLAAIRESFGTVPDLVTSPRDGDARLGRQDALRRP
ncbi:MAG: ribbon-helix-helix domain-containing protein [Bifidobacteriaceae bacterium]|jgi:hypothetical protein|nr:ribbon-helix-helix domain-containing protein [Bifidobacteriaceae bacterium]